MSPLPKGLSSQAMGMSAEYAVISDLLRQGCEVYRLACDEVNTDLVVFKNGTWRRVQIKAVGFMKTKTSVEVRMREYKQNDHIDTVAVYLWDRQIIAYYPFSGEKSICLALKTAKNKQGEFRKWFYEYEELV